MRSTVDLIKELETESAQHFCCILPVAFENTSIMINPTDENRLQLLNAAIQQGGIPIGLIVADKVAGTSTDFVVEKQPDGRDKIMNRAGAVTTKDIEDLEMAEQECSLLNKPTDKGGVLQLKARIFPEHLEHGPNEQAQEFMMKMMEGVRETLEK